MRNPTARVALATPESAPINHSGVADATRIDLILPPWVETHG